MSSLFIAFLIELSPVVAAPSEWSAESATCATVLEVSPTRSEDGSLLVIVGLDDARLADGTLVWKVHVPDTGDGETALVWGDLVAVDLSSVAGARGAPSGGVNTDGALQFVDRSCKSNSQKDVPSSSLTLSESDRSALTGRKEGGR